MVAVALIHQQRSGCEFDCNFVFYQDGFVSGARIKRDADDHVISSDPNLTKAQRRSMARADRDVGKCFTNGKSNV